MSVNQLEATLQAVTHTLAKLEKKDAMMKSF